MRRLAPLALAWLLLPWAASADDSDGIVRSLKLHGGFLLSKEVGERRVGAPGLDRAAAYAGSALARAGFSPLPGGGYEVPVPVALGRSGDGTALTAPGIEDLRHGPDYRSLPFAPDGAASGRLFFAGYGLALRDPAWNDYAGLDVEGTVVLVVDGGPPGAVAARSTEEIAKAAVGRGAAGVLIVRDPRTATFDRVVFEDGREEVGRVQDRGTEFLFAPRSGGRPLRLTLDQVREIRLAVPPAPPGIDGLEPAPGKPLEKPVLGISVPVADRLLGRSLATVLDAMDVSSRPGSFVREDVRVEIESRVERRTRQVAHVAAWRPGAERAVRAQAVIVTAPLAGPEEGGAALVLALADAIGREPPGKRTLIVILRSGAAGGDALLRRRLRLTPARIRGEIALESRGRAPALIAPEGENFAALRTRAAKARLTTGLVPGGEGASLAPLYPKGVERISLLAPRLPDSGAERGFAAARDAVRLAHALVLDRLDAPVPEGKKPPEKPAEKPKPAPKEPEPTLALVREARLAGKTDLARTRIDALLEKSPEDPELLFERGRVLMAAKDFEAARAEADRIEKLDGGAGWAWHLRGEIEEARGRPSEALEALGKAAEAGRPEAMLARAVFLLGQDGPASRFETIARDLSAAVAADADGAVGAAARGILAFLDSNQEEAEKWLGQAVEADPTLAAAWYWRGMLSVSGDRDPALGEADFGRALAEGMDPGRTRFNRGLCHLGAAKFTLAIRDFEWCVEAGALVNLSHYNIACAHGRMGNRDEALRRLALAVLAGFDDEDHARSDPDLSILHGDPEFERILRSEQTD